MRSLKQIKKIKLFIPIFLLLNFNLFSQKDNVVKVFGVIGTAYINERITQLEAKDEALKDAQRNALKKAGVAEYMRSNELLISSTVNDISSDFLSSEYESQLEGEILDYKIDTFFTEKMPNNLFLTTIIIDATVIKYNTKPDIDFDVKLVGVKNVYNNNDTLHFSLTPSIDCYLHIFSFIEDEATLVYPNTLEIDILLKKDTQITFPRNMKYELSVDNKKNEKGILIFVFTKKQVNFFQKDESQKTTPQNIYTWKNSIPLDQKKVITRPILIQY